MATPVILYGANGEPLLTQDSPWGNVLLTAAPPRLYGQFKAVTNSGEQTQTVIGCGDNQALFVTDVLLSANKTALSTTTLRFYDGTNAENIFVADTAESTVNLAIHPQGRTLGWNSAYIQLLTDKAAQTATCTIWYVRIKGSLVLSYSKWNALRGM